jgi:hypothetical protein
MIQAFHRQWEKTKFWAGRVFRGDHRLEKLELVPLLVPIADAISLYGEAVESKASAEFPESTEYSFEATAYHGVVIYEWKGLIHSITYWSAYADPGRDLVHMLKQYGGGQQWNVLTEGYLSQRADGKVRLWCSAVPAIGVGTADFLAAQGAAKWQHRAAEARTGIGSAGLEIDPPNPSLEI